MNPQEPHTPWIVSDTDLAQLNLSDLGEPVQLYYYLAGHAERGHCNTIMGYLNDHPLTPETAMAVAEALYEPGTYMASEAKWVECMKVASGSPNREFLCPSTLALAIHFHKRDMLEEAFDYAKVAFVNGMPEGAALAGDICERNGNFIEAARYYLMYSTLRNRQNEERPFKYLDEDELPINRRREWNLHTIQKWLYLLPPNQGRHLLQMIHWQG